jgi:hypothetical protein
MAINDNENNGNNDNNGAESASIIIMYGVMAVMSINKYYSIMLIMYNNEMIMAINAGCVIK